MDLKDRRAKDAIKALLLLEQAGYAARLAGGCVRDRLMGVAPMDYDVATTATPEQTMAAFRARAYKAIPTGIDHGTVTVVAASGPIEITTLRRDVATDGRRAQVAFGSSFAEDAERRDFTINAMFEDARGQIYDDFDGQRDIKAQKLRFVGDAKTRIREDYLRILRLFRFWAKLGFALVPGTLEAVTAEKGGLSGISQERITSELLKTFAGTFACDPLDALYRCGVWSIVMPELAEASPATASPLTRQFWPLSPDLSRERCGLGVLGALCLLACSNRDTAFWTSLGMRLRLPKSEVRALAWFPVLLERLKNLGSENADVLLVAEECDHHGGAHSLSQFYSPILNSLARNPWPLALQLLPALQRLQNTDAVSGHLRHKAMPVSGKDVMSLLGLQQGPALGQALDTLRRAYLNGAWRTRDEGLAYLQSLQDHRP